MHVVPAQLQPTCMQASADFTQEQAIQFLLMQCPALAALGSGSQMQPSVKSQVFLEDPIQILAAVPLIAPGAFARPSGLYPQHETLPFSRIPQLWSSPEARALNFPAGASLWPSPLSPQHVTVPSSRIPQL